MQSRSQIKGNPFTEPNNSNNNKRNNNNKKNHRNVTGSFSSGANFCSFVSSCKYYIAITDVYNNDTHVKNDLNIKYK